MAECEISPYSGYGDVLALDRLIRSGLCDEQAFGVRQTQQTLGAELGTRQTWSPANGRVSVGVPL